MAAAVALDFYDDGANGDKHAGNNLYTAQFPAPAANGDIEILVQATKGSIARYTGLLVPVAGRTATIVEGAGPESAIDANGNGYFDSLNIDVTFNVLEAGHYDVAGDSIPPMEKSWRTASTRLPWAANH